MKRRWFSILLIVIILLASSSCASAVKLTRSSGEAVIAPQELSDRDRTLLASFGIDGQGVILSFLTPASAKSLKANVYSLGKDGSWVFTGGSSMSLDKVEESGAGSNSSFSVLLEDDYTLRMQLDVGTRNKFRVNGPDSKDAVKMYTKTFLASPQKIEINQEIPVALFVYDQGTGIRDHTLADFHSPSKFEGMAFVQAVVLLFSDKVISKDN